MQFKEADMCVSFYVPSINTKNQMDTSISVFEDDISILMPHPTIQYSGIETILAPFQTEATVQYLSYQEISFICLSHLGLDLLDYFSSFGSNRHVLDIKRN